MRNIFRITYDVQQKIIVIIFLTILYIKILENNFSKHRANSLENCSKPLAENVEIT